MRSAPVYGVLLFLSFYAKEKNFQAPYFTPKILLGKSCHEDWWSQMLFIQNYKKPLNTVSKHFD
jgi:hypothetical protein